MHDTLQVARCKYCKSTIQLLRSANNVVPGIGIQLYVTIFRVVYDLTFTSYVKKKKTFQLSE